MLRRFEQLMEKRIPVWLAAMLLLVMLGFAIVLAWAVRHHLLAPRSSIGDLGNVAEFIATLPVLPRDIYAEIFGLSPLMVEDHFPDQPNGLTYFSDQKDDGYLLLSVFDGAAKRSVVKLIRLKDGRELHRWLPDLNEIQNRTRHQSDFAEKNNQRPKRYRIVHPYLQDDGAILFTPP